MKTTMKKALSLILTAAMLLSVALTATVATSAEDSNEKFNAYLEFTNSVALTQKHSGILVDGQKTNTEAEVVSKAYTGYIADPVKGGEFADKLGFGVSYSGPNSRYDGVGNYELHMNLLAADGSTITDICVIVGGVEFYINNEWNETAICKDHSDREAGAWDYSGTQWKKLDDNTYYEWMIPLSLIPLEKVYDETDLSTSLTITVTTSNGTYTKTGRLVLNDALSDVNYAGWFATKDVSSWDMTTHAAEATHDKDNKTTTMEATVNGESQAVARWNAKQSSSANYLWKLISEMAIEYNMSLTVSEMPAIAANATPVIDDGKAIVAETTPALMLYFTDVQPVISGSTYYCERGLTIAIYNKGGTLYIASATDDKGGISNEVSLGVAPSATEFNLRLVWLTNGNYEVFVNGVNKGTVASGTNGNNSTSKGFQLDCELHGGSNYKDQKQNVVIKNFTVGNTGYGLTELLAANSATPNYVPAIKFYQTSAVDNGTYNVRLIATVDKALVDAGDMTVAGFNVAASKTNGEGTVSGNTKAHKVYEVYSSITASGETVNAPEGTYFMVFTIKGIPAADVLTLNFSAFAETKTAAYVEGSVFTLTFQNGERKN